MDMLKKFTGGDDKSDTSTTSNPIATQQSTQSTQNIQKGQKDQSGSGGGMMDKVNNAFGGGAKGEKNEDSLDKGVDWVQENILRQGPQHNESAVEQAKDRAISDTIRKQYKK